ncbi:MAG: KDO2-lipid IV(A) lauroyltransferase [Flavobacteriales bacterium]|jgi:KDO2-lipid IV(A) lauroyltransferase
MPQIVFKKQLLHPRYISSWIAMVFWWLSVQLLPFPIQIYLGRQLGRVLYKKNIRRVRIARKNIELCFPELQKKEVEELTRRTLESTTIGIFESGCAWFLPRWRLKPRCTISGLEHLNNLGSQGAIFMGIHFTPIEIGAAFVNLEKGIAGFYRPHTNPVYEYIQAAGRIRHNENSQVIPNGDVRGIIKVLRKGGIVNYAPDQDYGHRRSIFAPFFNIDTATVKAPAQLARAGKAEVIPWTTKRLDDFGNYEVKIHPPITSKLSDSEENNAKLINHFIEQQIRKNPEQYLWVHKRFKTRPEGQLDIYN